VQLAARVLDQMTDAAASDLARAETLADRPLTAFPRTALAHYAKAQVLRAQQRFEEAISQYETVLAFNRNWVHGTGASNPPQSPRSEDLAILYWIGQVHLLESRIEEAIVWLENACGANPEISFFHAYLASAYALKDETERASAELFEAQRLSRDDRYSSIARLKALEYVGVPTMRARFEAIAFVGLRKAGMPEE